MAAWPWAMTDGTDIPYYWNLADNYVLFDRLFSSAKNGSFDNHMFLVAAAPPKNSNVSASGGYADVPTIFDRLQAKGIAWKYYTQNYDPTITYRDVVGKGNRESQVLWGAIVEILTASLITRSLIKILLT